jgi:hypothetical protein
MSIRQRHDSEALPIANYSSAIAKAVEWLGDRYLLAKPINAAPSGEGQAVGHGSAASTLFPVAYR